MLGNFSDQPATLGHTIIDEWKTAEVLITNITDPQPAALRPWEGTVYRRP